MDEGLVGGRFRVEGLLGVGGSASVYEAMDVSSGESVALKVLHPGLQGDAAARTALEAEASVGGRLRHPAFAAIVASEAAADGEHDGWIAFERIDGTSLAEHVAQSGPLPVTVALDLIDRLLDALGALHDEGLVHRDLSPTNVLVVVGAAADSAFERVVIIDLGLCGAAGITATRRSAEDGSEVVLGSLGYLAPEQARGEPVDERADLYAAAAVLHFAVTGRAPFQRSTVDGMLQAHQLALPPVPSSLRPELPRVVDRIVVRGMLARPGSRFASAAAMRRAITEATPPRTFAQFAVVHRATPSAPEAAHDRDALMTMRLPVASVRPVELGRLEPTPRSGRPPRRTRAAGSGRGLLIAAFVLVLAFFGGVWALAAASTPSEPPPAPAATEPAPPSAEPTPEPSSQPPPQPIEEPAPPPIEVAMPAVVALQLAEARTLIAAAGLQLAEPRPQYSPRPAGTVLAASVDAGAMLAPGTVLTISVASGWNRIPAVIGMSQLEAIAALREAGFSASSGSAAEVDEARVVESAPAAGSVARLDAPVALVLRVSEPGPEPEPEPTPAPTPAPTPTPDPAG